MDLANRAFAAINTAPEEEKEKRFLNFYQNLLQAKDLAPEKAEDIDTVLPLLRNLYATKFKEKFPEEAVRQAIPKHPFLTFLMPIIQAFKELATRVMPFYPEQQTDNSGPVPTNPLDQNAGTSTSTQQTSKDFSSLANEKNRETEFKQLLQKKENGRRALEGHADVLPTDSKSLLADASNNTETSVPITQNEDMTTFSAIPYKNRGKES